jgi:hypothetical protein
MHGALAVVARLLIVVLVVGAALAIGRVFGRRYFLKRRREQIRRGRKLFQLRREWLEAEFLTQASASGKPRGLRWAHCDFDNKVSFARDRNNGQLRALVGTTVSFEAIEGGDMEHIEAVGNLRSATAVFYYDGIRWNTDGRAIFNLSPSEAIEHFQHELEPV